MLTSNPALQALADQYCAKHHRAKPVRGHNVPVNSQLARVIAAEYALLPRIDGSAITRRCYKALFEQITDQFVFLTQAGYCIEPWKNIGQPYHSCEQLCCDVRDNYHLFVFTGGEPHPLLSQHTVRVHGITWSGNDVFRAVHDLLGHACEGYDFSEQGEENAWVHHSMMLTALAQWAMTTETRGQTCWYFSSPENIGRSLHMKTFAPQKAALLPVTLTLLPVAILEQWSA